MLKRTACIDDAKICVKCSVRAALGEAAGRKIFHPTSLSQTSFLFIY